MKVAGEKPRPRLLMVALEVVIFCSWILLLTPTPSPCYRCSSPLSSLVHIPPHLISPFLFPFKCPSTPPPHATLNKIIPMAKTCWKHNTQVETCKIHRMQFKKYESRFAKCMFTNKKILGQCHDFKLKSKFWNLSRKKIVSRVEKKELESRNRQHWPDVLSINVFTS